MPYTAPGWSCDPHACRPELRPVILAALRCIGVVEQPPGSNSGLEIDIMLKKAGVPPGSAWCASAVSDWYAAMTPSPLPRMASAYKIRSWAEKNGRVININADLQPGDILGILRQDFHGHVGLYVGPLKDDKLATIEGNVQSACRGLIRVRSDWGWAVRPLL